MNDRKLKEYALKIYNNVSGYSLQKAFDLFPKYYPKIAFYYSELITKKQEELTTRTIQSVGIDKARALLNELNTLHEVISKFYTTTSFKYDEYYKEIESAIYSDNIANIKSKAENNLVSLLNQLYIFDRKISEAYWKVQKEADKYKFNILQYDNLSEALRKNYKASLELEEQNLKFIKYINSLK